MKKESKRKGYRPEESKGNRPSLHDLYFTEEIDVEEELRLMEADPRLREVTGEPDTLDKIKAQWARMNTDVEMSEEIAGITGSDVRKSAADNKGATGQNITDVVSEDELSHLSPEARELLELGMKAKAEDSNDEPKLRVVRKRNKRIFFAVAAILVMSMAAGTTGVTSVYKYLQVEEKGEQDQFRAIESENDLVKSGTHTDEAEVYQQVDKFFGAPVVKLYGELVGLEFAQILLHEEDMSADIVYYWEGKSIFYSIQSNYNQLSNMSFLEEDLIGVKDAKVSDINVRVEKYNTNTKEHYNYSLSFIFNELYYKLVAVNITEKTIIEIINNLLY